MLRRRHLTQTQVARKAEGRQGTHETRRTRRSAARGVHGRPAARRIVALTPGDIFLATKNAGKRAEFDALFAGTPFTLRVFDGYRDPLEGETSYADNAALKAGALRAQLQHAGISAAVLADDSGLEVEALDGRPGVVTADYGGAGLDWGQRRRFVLDELAACGSADRRARFVCYLHYVDPQGRITTAFGAVNGTIAGEDRGFAGFSFDPIFIAGTAGPTFAELEPAAKNAISHRAQAVAALLAAL